MLHCASYIYNNKHNRNWFKILLFPVCLFMLSCNNSREEEKKVEEDSVVMAEDIAQEDSALLFENNADIWLDLSLNSNKGS